MGQNDDRIGQEDEDPSRTLDAVKPLYEIGSDLTGTKNDFFGTKFSSGRR